MLLMKSTINIVVLPSSEPHLRWPTGGGLIQWALPKEGPHVVFDLTWHAIAHMWVNINRAAGQGEEHLQSFILDEN